MLIATECKGKHQTTLTSRWIRSRGPMNPHFGWNQENSHLSGFHFVIDAITRSIWHCNPKCRIERNITRLWREICCPPLPPRKNHRSLPLALAFCNVTISRRITWLERQGETRNPIFAFVLNNYPRESKFIS